MEVVFVLYDILEKQLLYKLQPLVENIYQNLYSILCKLKTSGQLLNDLIYHVLFFVDWKCIFSLAVKTIAANWIVILAIMISIYQYRQHRIRNMQIKGDHALLSCQKNIKKYSICDICNMIKKGGKPNFVKNVISVLEETNIDLNSREPNSKSGLTPFLCACMSGSKELVEYMLKHGAAIKYQTFCQDGPLHIATFACANISSKDTFSVLVTLIQAGCGINARNWLGNTPLCIAASYDKERLIRFLIHQGADRSICNNDGIYPIDFATNAGNQHLCSLLTFKVYDPHVWDFIEPHTPPRIKLGLQTPSKKHLVDSSIPLTSTRKLNTFRTPRPVRSFTKDRKCRY